MYLFLVKTISAFSQNYTDLLSIMNTHKILPLISDCVKLLQNVCINMDKPSALWEEAFCFFESITFWFSEEAFQFVPKLPHKCKAEPNDSNIKMRTLYTWGENDIPYLYNACFFVFFCCPFANRFMDTSLHTFCMHRWDFYSFLEPQIQNGKLERTSFAFVICMWIRTSRILFKHTALHEFENLHPHKRYTWQSATNIPRI